MKKIQILLVILLTSILLTACINPSSSDAPTEMQGSTQDVVATDIEFGPHNLPLIHLTPAAQEIVLADFDYLAELILTNMPAQVITPRRFGITMEELLDLMRSLIVDFEPIESLHPLIMGGDIPWGSTDPLPTDDHEIAQHYLSSLLMWLAVEIENLGHLGPRDFNTYWEQLEHAAAAFHQSEVVDGRMYYSGELGWDIRLAQSRFDAFSAEATLNFFGVELADLDLYRDLSDIGFREADNIITEIIEDGHIARFRIRGFSNNPGFDSEILFPFLEEVQDFDHLIIDLRGNPGGWGHYFPDYIVSTLIDEPVIAYKNEFFMSGELAYRIAEYALVDWFGSADEIQVAADFVAQNDFPYFNYDDLATLTYVISWRRVIEPREDNIPFNGKIWLLVDNGSASASESAAIISATSGFATVVGSNTTGVTGTMHTYVTLPNTGVLFRIDTGYTIDQYGRLMEEFGVTPDIVVPIGTNILDYLLEIIANW